MCIGPILSVSKRRQWLQAIGLTLGCFVDALCNHCAFNESPFNKEMAIGFFDQAKKKLAAITN